MRLSTRGFARLLDKTCGDSTLAALLNDLVSTDDDDLTEYGHLCAEAIFDEICRLRPSARELATQTAREVRAAD